MYCPAVSAVYSWFDNRYRVFRGLAAEAEIAGGVWFWIELSLCEVGSKSDDEEIDFHFDDD